MSYTQKQTQGNDADSNWLSFASGHLYLASSFVASSSYSLRRVLVDLLKTGAPTFNITARIYSDSSDSPGSQLGSTSTTVQAASGLTGSFAAYEFVFPSDIALTNGTKYWVVLVASALGDGSNFVRWAGNPSGTLKQKDSGDGSAWTLVQSNMDGTISTFVLDAAVVGKIVKASQAVNRSNTY